MSSPARYNTQSSFVFGPYVDKTDGVTPETAVSTPTYLYVMKRGTYVPQEPMAWARLGIGYYRATMPSSVTDTTGRLRIDASTPSLAAAVWEDFHVISSSAYDALFNSGRMWSHAKMVSASAGVKAGDRTGYVLSGLTAQSAGRLDDMLDGTGSTLTLSQLRIHSVSPDGSVYITNRGGGHGILVTSTAPGKYGLYVIASSVAANFQSDGSNFQITGEYLLGTVFGDLTGKILGLGAGTIAGRGVAASLVGGGLSEQAFTATARSVLSSSVWQKSITRSVDSVGAIGATGRVLLAGSVWQNASRALSSSVGVLAGDRTGYGLTDAARALIAASAWQVAVTRSVDSVGSVGSTARNRVAGSVWHIAARTLTSSVGMLAGDRTGYALSAEGRLRVSSSVWDYPSRSVTSSVTASLDYARISSSVWQNATRTLSSSVGLLSTDQPTVAFSAADRASVAGSVWQRATRTLSSSVGVLATDRAGYSLSDTGRQLVSASVWQYPTRHTIDAGAGSSPWVVKIQTGAGDAIEGADVWLSTDALGNARIASGATDATGQKTLFPDVPAGTAAYLWVQHPQYTDSNPTSVTITYSA